MRVTLHTDNERVESSVWCDPTRHQLFTAILSKVAHETIYCSSVGHHHNVIADGFVAMETIFKVLRQNGLIVRL